MDSGAGHAPDPAAIERVRRDLAHLGADAGHAPDVPAAVSARIGAALRDASTPATHAVSGTNHSYVANPFRIATGAKS